MCSRYNLTSPHEAVRAYFKYARDEPFPPRFNIAPTQPVAIVRHDLKHERELALVRWGLIPSWVKDAAAFTTLINARVETVLEKPSFRGGIRHRRCLVPADGFYEWTGPAGAKRPFLIRPGAGGPMAFAGVWEHWLGADGSEIETMAILTMAANDKVRAIHDRMPAILPPDAFEAWLDCRGIRPDAAVKLISPLADSVLEVVEIDRRISNPRTEGPGAVVPVAPTQLLF